MVRAIDIQEKLLHLIGWEQNYDTSDLKISDALTVSESGLYFQQIHPLLTLQNIACIAPDFKNMQYEAFSLAKYYTKGDIVKFLDKIYRCKRDINGLSPDGEYKPVNLLEKYNFSFEDEENPLKGWAYSNDAITIDIVHPGYDSNTCISINTIGQWASISSIFSSNIAYIIGHKYRFQCAVKIHEDNTVNTLFNFYVDNKSKNFNDIPNDGNWHVLTYDLVMDKATVTVRLELVSPNTMCYIDSFSIRDITYEDSITNVEDYWEEIDPFSDWLESKTKASIQKAIARYCNEKIAQGTYKTLCENRTLFDGTGRLVDTVKNKKNLVGFEIIPVRAKGVTTKINKICLQFTKAGEYTLYLMHSSMDAPVKIIKLNKIRDNSAEWFTVDDLYLPYQSEDNDAGGSWYLCYFQSELPEGSQAIRKDKDWSKEPCNSCSRREYLAWMTWSKYIEVHPFFVNEELVEAVNFNDDFNDNFEKQTLHLWDVENNQYTYDNNYGLNLELTISCDITDFIIEQRMLFQDVIAKQVAVDMLREFAYNANVRTNRHSINASRLDILYEVDGDSSSMKKSGLSYQLDMAFKAIKLSTEGIDRVCLPCKNNGIKYRTV